MSENTILKEYSLGPGEVYMAPGKVDEGELYHIANKIGDTEGGCVLRYEYKLKELYDVWGDLVTALRFGEKVTVEGRLRRIFGSALPTIISGDRSSGGRGVVSVLLVCPLPRGECFRLYARGGMPNGATFLLREGGGIEFSITCGKDLSDPRFCMKSLSAEEVESK